MGLMMPNRPATVKQADLTRALKAAVAAGVQLSSYEIQPDGLIRFFIEGSASAPKPGAANSWDEVLDE